MNEQDAVRFSMSDGTNRCNAENIYAQFLRTVEFCPERPALEDAETWTYRQLNATAQHIAACIDASGIDPARPLLVLGPDGAATTAMVLAVLAIGRVAGVLPWSQPPAQLAALIQKLNCGLLCTVENVEMNRLLLDTIDAPVLVCDAARRNDAQPSTPHHASEQDPALLLFTSGSTGLSKAVLRSHRTVLWNAENLNKAHARSTVLWKSMAYASGMQTVLLTVLSGATGWFFDVKAQGLARLAGWMAERRINGISLPVGVFRDYLTLLESGAAQAPLTTINVSGILYRRDVERARKLLPPEVIIVTSYSASELSMMARANWMHDTPLPEDDGPLPVGPPMRDVQVFIRDENGRDVPRGEKGRIFVRKKAMMLGYHGDAVATTARFRMVDDAGTLEFDTGDLGSFDEQGWLRVYGRIDEVVKIRGLRIDLKAVDAALAALPVVRHASSYACVSAGVEALGATIALQPGVSLDMSTLRTAVLQRLPDYMAPTDVRITAELPLTMTGKIDRRATAGLHDGLPRLPDRAEAVREDLRDDVERTLAKIWEDALGRTVDDRRADFYMLGGHSLIAMRVAAQIEKHFRVNRTVADLFAHPVLGDQAMLIRSRDPNGRSADAIRALRVLRTAGNELPVLFISNASRPITMAMPLVTALPPAWPVYGMQPFGIYPGSVPSATIEEEAERYLNEMRTAGMRCRAVIAVCGGALAALEMMHRWPAVESDLPLLVLLDPSAASLGTSDRELKQPRSLIVHYLRNRQYSKLHTKLVELAKLTIFRRYYPELPHWQRMKRYAQARRANHVVQPYAGAVLHLVSAETARVIDHAAKWRAVCVGDYEQHVIAHSNHRSFYSGGPAQQVSAYIVQALERRGA